MIKPGSFMQVNEKLHLIVAVVPSDKYCLILESDPIRLRQLTPAEWMLLTIDSDDEEPPMAYDHTGSR